MTKYEDGKLALSNVADLRLIGINKRVLGSTEWKFRASAMPENIIRINRDVMYSMPSASPFYAGREIEVFESQIGSLPPISNHSTDGEIRAYIYDVLMTACICNMWKVNGGKSRVRVALQTVNEIRPELLLKLPDNVMHKDELVDIVAGFVSEEDKPAILASLIDRPWVSEIIEKRKWRNDALPYTKKLANWDGKLDHRIILLMRQVDDENVRARLVKEIDRYPWAYFSFQSAVALTKEGHFRSELEGIADKNWKRIIPSLKGYEWHTVLMAATFGNQDALDVAIRIGRTGKKPEKKFRDWNNNQLAPMLGFNKATTSKEADELLKQLRTLSASDFIYLPSELRWERKAP